MALFMAPALFTDLVAGAHTTSYFVIAMVAATFAGATLLALSASTEVFSLTRKQAFLTTGIAWILAPAFGAIPFLSMNIGYIDAYFEAVSGITTSGATVLVGLDDMPRGILLWRSLLHWIGGVGIIVIGIIIMPFLGVGGMQLFKTESSDSSEKLFARGLDLARWIAVVYLALSILCAGVYAALGMSAFDAINHAMSTISTGGFSTHDASFIFFESPAIEWTAVAFMIAGALPFVAYIRMLRGRQAIYDDVQVRAFIAFLVLTCLVIAVTNTELNGVPFSEALRLSAFSVTSIVTTTGFANSDYQEWGAFAVGAFFILIFVGGCSGSTSGGIKIYRFQILAKSIHAYLTRLISPSQVKVITYSTRRVGSDVEFAILTFLAMVLVSEVVLTLILCWIGVDFLTAASTVAASLGNVGPGLGPIAGPVGNFSTLPDAAKAVLSLAMLLGRLEYFTLLVMLTPAFWRD